MIFCSGVYRENPVLALPEFEPGEGAVEPGISATAMGTEKPVEEDVFELVPEDARRWVKKAIAFYRS